MEENVVEQNAGRRWRKKWRWRMRVKGKGARGRERVVQYRLDGKL